MDDDGRARLDPDGGAILIGPLRVSFHRTLRLPDDGRDYPLPPSLGRLPLRPVGSGAGGLPSSWGRDDHVLPLHAREALWLGFATEDDVPRALQIGVGGVDAVAGRPWHVRPSIPQNYVVCPDQPWLDGVLVGPGTVRQFVAVRRGAGHTVDEQVRGADDAPGLHLRAFPLLPGIAPRRRTAPSSPAAAGLDLGLGAGGRMTQRIHADPYGPAAWDLADERSTTIHLVPPAEFERLTGSPAPPSPVDARTYTEAGLPWFAWEDDPEDAPLDPGEGPLTEVRSPRELDGDPAEPSVPVDPTQVRRVGRDGPVE